MLEQHLSIGQPMIMFMMVEVVEQIIIGEKTLQVVTSLDNLSDIIGCLIEQELL